ncbi:MAG: glycosyltransferase family 4 protein [Eubacteriales bacterium]
MKKRFLLEVDGGIIRQENKLKYLIKRYFISSASAWLSSGDKTNEYLTYYGADKNNLYTYQFTSLWGKDICKKVYDKETKKSIREELDIKEKNVVISIGQFIYRKGFDILLKAAKSLNDTGVYIVGSKPTKEYEKIISDYGIKNIYFPGFKKKEELKKYYEAADLFVLPTREDIWGLVINEAMANSLPVITTDNCVAGLELVENDVNGYIVPVDNVKELADKINKILSNEDLKNKMAGNSLDKIKSYTIENMVKRHIDVFNQFLGEKS